MIKIEQFENITKDDTVLLIVESPNKCKTLSQFLPKNFIVKATVGHLYKIADSGLYNMGIDVKNNFTPDYQVIQGKDSAIKDLKEAYSRCDKVLICSDGDREGEFIAQSVKNLLKIPNNKYKRCIFHEITEKAVLKAINNPIKIDDNLVSASESRSILDKIVGYRLSPIARNKVSARSVGRCQSAALKLVVEREEEILNFDSKKFYELWLPFVKDKKEYKAQYKGLLSQKKNTPTIDSESKAKYILEACKDAKFKVKNIESSDRSVSPKPPFITSSFQQEVSSKLGYSVKKAMECAQRLFEGISIGGKHIALITYIRTDSITMDPDFEKDLEAYIKKEYGDKYFAGARKEKKKKNVQDGHECIRPVDLTMTPEKLSSYINDTQLLKVYSIIYNRTVASLMSDCIITDTDFVITEDKNTYKFIYTEHAIKYDGFRKVYALDDEELVQGLDVFVGEQLDTKELNLLEKETQPPKRYSESSLIKKLEALGIGRPSTYASIINVLLDTKRDYCKEEGKSIAPTEKGMNLSHFLDEAFPQLINYDYTAKLEEKLDLIAKGATKELDFLNEFYSELEKMIKNSRSVVIEKPEAEEYEGHTCPNCGSTLIIRNGRYGKFAACPKFPRCRHTEKIEG